METKITPGPWAVWEGHAEVYAVTEGRTDNRPGCISGARGQIADFESLGERDYAEDVANAHLCAAAPDLLLLCRQILLFPPQEIMIPHPDLYERLKLAVAKATTLPEIEGRCRVCGSHDADEGYCGEHCPATTD